ncbi:MAG: MraY family glycosyltransferase, partial [Endomicrobiales bacterium]
MSSTRKALYALLIILLLFLLQPHGGTWAWLANMRWLYVFLVAFIFAYLLTPVSIYLGWRFNILDNPDVHRKFQAKPVPRIGGLAIFLAILLSTIRNFEFSPQLTALMIASSLMFFLGFVDDIYPLRASFRIGVQIIASLIVVNSGIYITIIPLHWPFHYALSAIITVVWLIGMSNAINFMDGVDGLCTSMVALTSTLFFLISWHTHQTYVSFLLIALSGACLGFLPYNWKRATVYLGDAGSTFIGFLIAALAVMGAWSDYNPMVALSTPLMILGIPIFDMIY